MYNAYEPFVKLANANLALFQRFANSSDITQLVQDTVSRAFTLSQESITKVSQTNAYNEWTRGLVDNFTRFTQDYVNGLTESMARSQEVLMKQVEQGSQQFTQIAEQAEQKTDDIAEAGQRIARVANERGPRSTK